MPTGRQWFPLASRNVNERWHGVSHAAPVLQRFLDLELVRHNLPPSALAIVGFSQGTMLALHVGLRCAVAPLAVVGYSGALVVPQDVEPEGIAGEITSRPPVLLVTATATTSFRFRRCSRPPAASLLSTCRPNGTSRVASVMASTRKACAMAASFSTAPLRARNPKNPMAAKHPPALDRIDIRILAALQRDGRSTNEKLSSTVPSRHAPVSSACAAWRQRESLRVTRP